MNRSVCDEDVKRMNGPRDFSKWVAYLLICAICLAFVGPLAVGFPEGELIPVLGGTVVETPALCSQGNLGCHDIGSTLNMVGSVMVIGAPAAYIPGRTYQMMLQITGDAQTQFYGFQLAAFFESSKEQAGVLSSSTPGVGKLTLANGIQLLTHSMDPLASGLVTFSWTAPHSEELVLIRVASNSANGNSAPTGDHINTAEVSIPAVPVAVAYYPQIGAGLAGDSRFSTELVFVNAGAAVPLEVEFFAGQGQAQEFLVSINGEPQGEVSQISRDLSLGETLTVRLDRDGVVVPGYARITTADWVGSTAVFSQFDSQGGALYEAGVPATSPLTVFSLAADFEQDVRNTGVAIVNPAPEAGVAGDSGSANLTMRLYDQSFELVMEKQRTLGPGEHLPLFITEIFDFFPPVHDPIIKLNPFLGSMTVESDRPVAAVTLRQTNAPTLTAFPVIPGRAVNSEGVTP